MNREKKHDKEPGRIMDEKDSLQTLLEIEKNMSNNYSIAMNEASTEELYETFFDMFTSIKDTARDIFDLMNQYGWYKLENVEEEKITKASKKLSQQLSDLEES